jgi:hypothetical protein
MDSSLERESAGHGGRIGSTEPCAALRTSAVAVAMGSSLSIDASSELLKSLHGEGIGLDPDAGRLLDTSQHSNPHE